MDQVWFGVFKDFLRAIMASLAIGLLWSGTAIVFVLALSSIGA